MNRAFVFLFCTLVYSHVSNAQYSTGVKAALVQAGSNHAELRKALDHFYRSGDSLKIRSINFLIESMPIHKSYSYYWADSTGRRIAFNELDYATFNDAVSAFNDLKNKHGRLRPVPYTYRDIDSIKAPYLIAHVESACKAWKETKASSTPGNQNATEEEFMEYILPYRVDVECLTDWKTAYQERFRNSFSGDFAADSVRLRQHINDSFKNLWGMEARTEPLPRLNALQILLRGKGYCEDMANMAVFAARSQGVPATVDNIPAWGTSTGNHTMNYLQFDPLHRHFDSGLDSLGREPAKVVRTTYSVQPDAIASWLDTSRIPHGFLRLKNYKDVTHEYWKTGDFSIALFPNSTSQAVFAGVLNGGNIVPVWYAKKEGNSATFRNMSQGVVYFPFYFENGAMMPAGYPVALGYESKTELRPDPANTRSITLQEQERYLKFRPGKQYQLLIWDNGWKLLGSQAAPEGATELVFDKVPANALLLLRPEYSQGKERPFTIRANGERAWW
jgi:hypothetical protein